MLKERIYNILNILFFCVLIIYLFNRPPTIIIKYPVIDKLTNVSYI
jgi:hypothetical protein